MARDVGTNINQYKIISRLGAGGMGEVYLAQDVRLERKVALKLLNAEVTKNEEWCVVLNRKRAPLRPSITRTSSRFTRWGKWESPISSARNSLKATRCASV